MGFMTAMAVGGLATSAVGTGKQYYNAKQQAKTAQEVGSYNAAVIMDAAEYNADTAAKVAEYNARAVEQETIYNSVLARQQAEWNARVIERTTGYNVAATRMAADIEEMLAKQAVAVAEGNFKEKAGLIQREGRQVMASQRAGYAGSGIAIGSGTPLEMEAETAQEIEKAVMREKRAFDVGAADIETRSALSRYVAGASADLMQMEGDAEAFSLRAQGEATAFANKYFGDQQAWATRYFGARDVQNIRSQAAQEAEAQRRYAASAAAGYRAQATGSLLTGASNLAFKGADLRYQGVI